MVIEDDESDFVLIFQEDPNCKSDVKLKDLNIGDSFIFNGKRFEKLNNYGWAFGFLNIRSDEGDSHIHPTTRISLIH